LPQWNRLRHQLGDGLLLWANLKVETNVETEYHGGEKLKLKLMVVNGGIGDGMLMGLK
jgi:hypothetical protein